MPRQEWMGKSSLSVQKEGAGLGVVRGRYDREQINRRWAVEVAVRVVHLRK